ncbi:MAG: type II toxin-antitoxin system PemK/MazF family toxin [Pyrinomonadaceae bacterium]
MVIRRGQIWWADLGTPRGSGPGYERPIVVIQADVFNKTDVRSVIVAIVTTSLRLAKMPGNVPVSRGIGGLVEDSVINITQLFTLDRDDLIEHLGELSAEKIDQVDKGLRLVLSLDKK